MKHHFKLPLFVLLLIGCETKSPKEISPTYKASGQIFITQKNQVNLELGGVVVTYCDAEIVEKEFSNLAEDLSRALTLTKYLETNNNLQNFATKIASLENIQDPLTEDLYDSLLDRHRLAKSKVTESAECKRLIGISEIVDSNEELFHNSNFSSTLDKYAIASLFFDWLPKQDENTTETDSQGQFSIDFKGNGRGYLFATASRVLGTSKQENYYWIIPVDYRKNVKPMIINGSKLLDSEVLNMYLNKHRVKPINYPIEQLENDFDLPNHQIALQITDLFYNLQRANEDISKKQKALEKIKEEIKQINLLTDPN